MSSLASYRSWRIRVTCYHHHHHHHPHRHSSSWWDPSYYYYYHYCYGDDNDHRPRQRKRKLRCTRTLNFSQQSRGIPGTINWYCVRTGTVRVLWTCTTSNAIKNRYLMNSLLTVLSMSKSAQRLIHPGIHLIKNQYVLYQIYTPKVSSIVSILYRCIRVCVCVCVCVFVCICVLVLDGDLLLVLWTGFDSIWNRMWRRRKIKLPSSSILDDRYVEDSQVKSSQVKSSRYPVESESESSQVVWIQSTNNTTSREYNSSSAVNEEAEVNYKYPFFSSTSCDHVHHDWLMLIERVVVRYTRMSSSQFQSLWEWRRNQISSFNTNRQQKIRAELTKKTNQFVLVCSDDLFGTTKKKRDPRKK